MRFFLFILRNEEANSIEQKRKLIINDSSLSEKKKRKVDFLSLVNVEWFVLSNTFFCLIIVRSRPKKNKWKPTNVSILMFENVCRSLKNLFLAATSVDIFYGIEWGETNFHRLSFGEKSLNDFLFSSCVVFLSFCLFSPRLLNLLTEKILFVLSRTILGKVFD